MMLCHTGSRSLVPVGQMQEPVEGNSCALGSASAMRASPADVGRLSDTVDLSHSLTLSLSHSLTLSLSRSLALSLSRSLLLGHAGSLKHWLEFALINKSCQRREAARPSNLLAADEDFREGGRAVFTHTRKGDARLRGTAGGKEKNKKY